MNTSVPQLLGDLSHWLDTDLPVRTGHRIRVEESTAHMEYRLRAELPGLQPDTDIQVGVVDGTLTIHADRQHQDHTAGRSEFRYGPLHRSVRLPANADTEHITSAYRDGILEVNVPLGTPLRGEQHIPIGQ
jgi:HSP20 family molecular chaperone IbpA